MRGKGGRNQTNETNSKRLPADSNAKNNPSLSRGRARGRSDLPVERKDKTDVSSPSPSPTRRTIFENSPIEPKSLDTLFRSTTPSLPKPHTASMSSDNEGTDVDAIEILSNSMAEEKEANTRPQSQAQSRSTFMKRILVHLHPVPPVTGTTLDIVNRGSFVQLNLPFQQFQVSKKPRATIKINPQQYERLTSVVVGTMPKLIASTNLNNYQVTCFKQRLNWEFLESRVSNGAVCCTRTHEFVTKVNASEIALRAAFAHYCELAPATESMDGPKFLRFLKDCPGLLRDAEKKPPTKVDVDLVFAKSCAKVV